MIASSKLRSLRDADAQVLAWLARHGVACMRFSIAVVFLWFGLLKLFPGLSPAEELAGRTILALSLGMAPPELSVPVLGVFEAMLGGCLLTGRALRPALVALLVHMLGTSLPFLLLPDVVLGEEFPGLTLEGQYIVKNLVIISGAFIIGATSCRRDSPRPRRSGGKTGRSREFGHAPAPPRRSLEHADVGSQPARTFGAS